MEKHPDQLPPPFVPGTGGAPGGDPDTGRFVRLGLVFYAALLGLTGLVSALSGRSPLYASAEAAARGVAWERDVGVGLVAAALVVAASALFTATTRAGERLAQAMAQLLGPLRGRDCLLLAAASGVAEEAIFRGVLQPWLGWVAASLLFGLVHVAPRRDLLAWTGFAIAAGFGLGALFEVTGNLIAPIVAHAGVNAVNLKLLADRYRASP